MVGCFDPTYNNPTCGPNGACPNGLTCNTSSMVCERGGGGGSDDAAVDGALVDAPAECALWTPRHIAPCAIGAPKPPVVITAAASPWTYNTTAAGGLLSDRTGAVLASSVTVTQVDSSVVAVLNVEALTVEAGATLFVVGPKPLVIASWSTIRVDGVVDAGSTTFETNATTHVDGPQRTGAGASVTSQCVGLTGIAGAPSIASGGSGAGGGGGLRGAGGAGTAGDAGAMIMGGPGGSKLVSIPTVIRGGCSGGPSGNAGSSSPISPATSSSFSVGGAGGGAIELVARTSITVSGTGTVNAGGAGGGGSPQGASVGGGGGGSGGYIGLDAPMVTVSGHLSANGAGGGGGAPYLGNGNQGENSSSTTTAAGGAVFGAGQCGVGGAAGSSGPVLDGRTTGSTDSCGGSGGGGGAGFILVVSPSFTAPGGAISPAVQEL